MGDGDGGIDQHGICPDFEGFGGVARCADAGIYHHRDGGLGDDDFDLPACGDALVGADGGAQGHDGGGAHILQAAGQHGVCIDVGKDDEAFFDQDFSRLEGFNRVRKEVAGIWMDFQLHPVRQASGHGETGEAHRWCWAGVGLPWG